MKLHLPSLVLGGMLVSGLAISGWAMAAKDVCPEGSTCYEGHVLEFDEDDGPIQFLAINTTSLTTTSLDGQSIDGTVQFAEFVMGDDDLYVQRGNALPPYPKVGEFANANVGDTYVLIKAGT